MAMRVSMRGYLPMTNEPEEYHRMVRWYADLRSTPISSAEVVVFHGTNPRQAFGALNKGKEAILALIAKKVEQNDINDLLARGEGTLNGDRHTVPGPARPRQVSGRIARIVGPEMCGNGVRS